MIAPIEVRGRQGSSYRSPPVQRSTPSSVFQYDNNTDLQLDNTGYLMTLAMLGEDTGYRVQDISQFDNLTGSLGVAAFGVMALGTSGRRKRSTERSGVGGRNSS